MSRIDEALARSRNMRPEDLAANVSPVASDVQFASESGSVGEPSTAPPEVTHVRPAEEVPAPPANDAISAEEPAADPLPNPTLGEDEQHPRVPFAEKLATASADSTSTEQYRRLAGRLYVAQAESGMRIVMVTSAMPGEGKTLTATNLALTLAESYKRQVLLIDADLRRPWVHEMFQIPNVSGLNDGLRTPDERKVPLLRLTDHLTVLTAGRPDRDPMSVLSSERMQRVIREAGARFDWVIIDTPPVALLTDAHLLAALVDSVILVIQAGKTPLPAINKAVQAVGRDRVMGVVLNRADDALVYHTYYYYSSYGQVPAGKAAE